MNYISRYVIIPTNGLQIDGKPMTLCRKGIKKIILVKLLAHEVFSVDDDDINYVLSLPTTMIKKLA
jgi:hypothetical protein